MSGWLFFVVSSFSPSIASSSCDSCHVLFLFLCENQTESVSQALGSRYLSSNTQAISIEIDEGKGLRNCSSRECCSWREERRRAFGDKFDPIPLMTHVVAWCLHVVCWQSPLMRKGLQSKIERRRNRGSSSNLLYYKEETRSSRIESIHCLRWDCYHSIMPLTGFDQETEFRSINRLWFNWKHLLWSCLPTKRKKDSQFNYHMSLINWDRSLFIVSWKQWCPPETGSTLLYSSVYLSWQEAKKGAEENIIHQLVSPKEQTK